MSALFFPNQQVSPDEKIFTTADERGFLPHTPTPRKHFLPQTLV
ncbi:MAG: hypothetical protein PX481_07065 [Microcystis sp. M53603_WE2]|nr:MULTISPECIES: hypothetical protein [unclassified Microcystis]MCZ8364736.1 hypothetical protein [Microcystis sp. LE19-251.1A]MDJ0566011.1 hypothetical protein [Microcystis sp. M49629_WE12]MCZ8028073.1 hypothetical protein [Microcystis sp. LE19-10.1B]MDJ0538451.1 hypothetical protein [Microcystis sp. M53603_WE2]MDJ0604397.1 hypothetical protein [Microcystis sp. M53602_WE12]